MAQAIEHYVFLIFDRKAFTEEMRERILTLGERARTAGYEGIISNKDVFVDDDASETIGAISYWYYASEEAKDRFLKSPMHLDHLAFVKPAMIEKFVYDRFVEI